MESGYIHYTSNERDQISACGSRHNLTSYIGSVTCPDCQDVYRKAGEIIRHLGLPEEIIDLAVRLVIAQEELIVYADRVIPETFFIERITDLIDQIATVRNQHNTKIGSLAA